MGFLLASVLIVAATLLLGTVLCELPQIKYVKSFRMTTWVVCSALAALLMWRAYNNGTWLSNPHIVVKQVSWNVPQPGGQATATIHYTNDGNDKTTSISDGVVYFVASSRRAGTSFDQNMPKDDVWSKVLYDEKTWERPTVKKEEMLINTDTQMTLKSWPLVPPQLEMLHSGSGTLYTITNIAYKKRGKVCLIRFCAYMDKGNTDVCPANNLELECK